MTECSLRHLTFFLISFSLCFKGVSKGNPEAIRIIRRRAPPCLNVFCRLGCVCASLVHLRRHHHCGKPQCMLGCSCLRRKVIALKTPKQEQSATDKSEPQGVSEKNKAKWKKKYKKRKTYGQSTIYCNRCTIIITKI